MHSVTLSSACLLFLAMAGVDIQSAGQMITCDAGTFKVGEPAYITCHFRTNVNDTKRSINMARYPPDSPKGSIGTDVILCPWSEEKKKHDCFTEMDNYELVGDITDRLTVKIPEVSFEQADLYMCFFVPSDQTDPYPCELHVQAGPESSSSDKQETNSDKTGGKQSLLLIILPCVIVIVAIASLGVFVLLKRRSRRCRCRCTTESEPCESTQAMIPLEVEQFLEDFRVSNLTLDKIMKLLNKGLEGEAGTAADVKMYPTFVGPLPQQSENEEFLVLDLNYPGVKLALVRLKDHNSSIIRSENYIPPPRVQLDTVEELSGFIAMCICTFTEKRKPAGKEWPLALIFPFPCQHEGLDRACLVKWTKEVTCKDVEGKELHGLIRGALDKTIVNSKKQKKTAEKIKIVAIVNDTVSTLASAAYNNPDCKIGLVVDAGLNACYHGNWTHTKVPQDEKAMIINTELGAIGENGCLDFCRTEYDKELDEYSSSLGSQFLEKMVSGMYLGEIVRLVLEGLTRKNLMFRSVPRACNLFHRGSFNTECVFGIESDNEESHQATKKILDHLAVKNYTDEDVKNVRRVCSIISERAACFTAASLATLINHVNLSPVTVVVDGYLYQRHPRFHDMMFRKTQELVNPELEFHLVGPQVERSIGAARIAAAALRSGNSRTDTPGATGATQDRGSSYTEPEQPSQIDL